MIPELDRRVSMRLRRLLTFCSAALSVLTAFCIFLVGSASAHVDFLVIAPPSWTGGCGHHSTDYAVPIDWTFSCGAGCPIEVDPATPIAESGGHLSGHDETLRPPLTLVAPDGSSTANGPIYGTDPGGGWTGVTSIVPEPAGSYTFVVTCRCPNSLEVQRTWEVDVELRGLIGLPSSGPGFIGTPSTGNSFHGAGNLNGTPFMINALEAIPGPFSQVVTVSQNETPVTLIYTSISLPTGGLFDLNSDWQSPGTLGHCAHRNGRNADMAIQHMDGSGNIITDVPVDQRNALLISIYDAGLTMPVKPESDLNTSTEKKVHWHLVQ